MKKFVFLYMFFISASLFAANVNLLLQNDGLGAGTVTIGGQGVLQTCSNITGTGCALTIPSGTEIKISALPQAGTTFQSWTAGTGSTATCAQGNNKTNRVCVVTINQNSTLKFAFATGAPLEMKVQFSIAGRGRVVAQPIAGPNLFICSTNCVNNINAGSVFLLQAAPDSGSTFAGFTNGTGSATSCSSTPCRVVLTEKSSVAVNFRAPQFQLSIATTGNGQGTVKSDPSGPINCASGGTSRGGCSASVVQGSVSLKATPAAGSKFSKWSGGTGSATSCNNSTNPICNFSISQNSTIQAEFLLN